MDESTKQIYRDKGFVEIRPDVWEKRGHPFSERIGERPIVQDGQASNLGKDEERKTLRKAGNKKEARAMDEAGHPKYRITVVWHVSDRRQRDGDGMLTTAMDCVKRAARRLAGLDTGKRRVED